MGASLTPPPRTLTTSVRHRTEDRPIDGVLLVDKPAGVTSHDVVSVARRALHTRRIGHAGTLDPFATGLLVLLVGQATRLLPHMNGEPKVYRALISFGAETDTDDATGRVTRTAVLPEIDRVRDALVSLTGAIEQVPPAYSAKLVDGKRAYAAARAGRALELPPTVVVVHAWDIHELTPDHLDATITCAGGTYIRALARDLGRLSGSAAHVAGLRRVRSGSFDVGEAVTVDTLRSEPVHLRPPIAAVSHLTRVALSPDEAVRVRHGQPLDVREGAATSAALTDGEGSLVAVAERAGAVWQPRVVLT